MISFIQYDANGNGVYVRLMVQEVVGAVVAYVSEDAAAVRYHSRMIVPKDDAVRDLPEWSRQDDEECGRHDKPVFIHGEIVVNAVEQEMRCDGEAVVGQMACP
jgi:hypothetical protein